jgi:site-specific recombinase XerD
MRVTAWVVDFVVVSKYRQMSLIYPIKHKLKQTKSKPNLNQAPFRLPKGIRMFTRTGRRKPFYCSWLDPETGRYHSTAFEKEALQLAFAKDLAKRRMDDGKNILNFDAVKWRRFLEFEALIGGIDRLPEVERLWLDRSRPARGPLLEPVTKDFLIAKDRQGISADTYSRYKALVERLLWSFPGADLDTLDAALLTGWIDELKHPNGKPQTAVSKNNWRRYLNTFFNYAVKHRLIEHNPVDLVIVARVEEKPVGILTPEEGTQFFARNKGEALIGRLALEAFAGLRYSSAMRLQKAHINFEDEGISLPGSILKTGKRFYIDGFPSNLWKWLRLAPAACWTMTERQYQEGKKLAFVRAGIGHPKNCLRHSFCTYHVAKFKNVGETATLLCHTNIGTLNRFYRGVATHAAGRAWFGICP